MPEVNSHKLKLIGSMVDETESQISDVPNLTEASAEVHEQFRRTEAERVRLAAAAQGAIPRGMVGDSRGAVGGAVKGGGGDAPANPRGEHEANVQANPRGDQDNRRDAQI
jgi:L-aminopeptidase/D-esterase-like protein